MKITKVIGISLLLSACMFVVAWAGDFDGTRPLLCTVISVIESTPSENRSVSAESIGLPQFIMIDSAKKKIWPAMDKEGNKTSEIKRVDHVGGNLILQGVDEGIEKKREAVSWTATISEETGKLVLTAAGDQVGFVIFGACLPQ